MKSKELVELAEGRISEEEKIKKFSISEFFSYLISRHQINEDRNRQIEKMNEKNNQSSKRK